MKGLPHGPGRTATVSYILCDFFFFFSVLNLILVVLSCLELDLSLLFKELLFKNSYYVFSAYSKCCRLDCLESSL